METPYLVTDVELIEKVQKQAAKYILCDYTSSYKERLIRLKLLPLMYIYELANIMFFIKSLKFPTHKLNTCSY